MAKPIMERFSEKYIPVTESGCWIWLACTTKAGYGQIYKDGKPYYAHRLSYEMTIGAIPVGFELDHLCRVRCCVNPDHLEPVTHKTNIHRGVGIGKSKPLKCKHGHEFTEENTYIPPGRYQRVCKICAKNRVIKFKSKEINSA